MFISVFDIFKIGIGPSSSHTVGPMVAVSKYLDRLKGIPGLSDREDLRISVTLHGSLAFTGKGHATDQAVCLGFLGARPDTLDPDAVDTMMTALRHEKSISPDGLPGMAFDPENDVIFDYGPPLPLHSNAMTFKLQDSDGKAVDQFVYYSIGGGFVVTEAELSNTRNTRDELTPQDVPYPFASATQMLEMGRKEERSIAEMKLANECAELSQAEVEAKIDGIWSAMDSCINRGINGGGILPGGLKVKRRAGEIYQKLIREGRSNPPFEHTVMDWLGVYAMAVNEENAGGGRVVTAPTNGAAGVIPAVTRYYLDHCPDADNEGIRTFLLTAAAIGGIIKTNASISGAEVGCQGEVGSASAMAAAGLCAALGGTNEQIENAAEIALEHHLGMTCDPIAGLVQVPCIERNALGAVKAVTAASLALRGDGSHFVPLDGCIETMRQTGLDMSDQYKETSTGGLAVNIVEC